MKDAPAKDPSYTAVTAPTKYASIGQKKLAYRSIGAGKPLILCNRFRGILDSWDPAFIDELAKEFQVIIFDYSGIGLSSGTLPAKIAEVADDVKDLAAFLQLKKFIIGGWSYGGIVAQTFSTHYPDAITHTVLIGTNPPGKNENPPETIFLETSAKPVNDLDDEVILFFEPASEISLKAAKLSHDRIAQRVKDKDSMVTVEKFGLYFKGVADYAADQFNSREKLGKLKTPVLSISGDHDCVCPVENWYPLTRKMKNLQIIMLPQAGHGPQHQYPEICVKYISNFVHHFTLE
jgi:pimeloyl-ACP methyl ester carboxylesterase